MNKIEEIAAMLKQYDIKDLKNVRDLNDLKDFLAHKEEEKKKGKKPSMSMATAFTLSMRNLVTKRARTILTAVAGSIGIIGIALVLALSNGINGYIAKIESDALLLFPMSVEKEAIGDGYGIAEEQ